MNKIAFILFFIFVTFCSAGVKAAGYEVPHVQMEKNVQINNHVPSPAITLPHPTTTTQQNTTTVFNAITRLPGVTGNMTALFWLFIQCILIGLLAVFTPYIYTIHPFTTGYLSRNVASAKIRVMNTLIYAFSLMAVFSLLGVLIAVIIKFTGVRNFVDSWIFNLFFFRIFITLGISFLGAFAIKLPASWINAMAKNAKSNNFKGIFIMAVTLPGASFSSTFPIVGLVLLLACNVSIAGPVVGLLGFAVGLALPFVFPVLLNIFVKSKSLLNNIKVIMGFLSLMIALKFLSKTDAALGYHLIDRDIFIEIWMGLLAIMGFYMLGLIKLSNDTEAELNLYGQEYLSLSRLFIAIAAFTFALYLLPGIWGAPLHSVNNFLPQQVL